MLLRISVVFISTSLKPAFLYNLCHILGRAFHVVEQGKGSHLSFFQKHLPTNESFCDEFAEIWKEEMWNKDVLNKLFLFDLLRFPQILLFVTDKTSFWLGLWFLRLNVYFKCSVILRIWFRSEFVQKPAQTLNFISWVCIKFGVVLSDFY